MLVRWTVRSAILAPASVFLLIGLTPFHAAAFTKTQCIACGCKYTIDCETGPQGDLCLRTCLCSAAQDECMNKKLSGVTGLSISKTPSKTTYRLRVAPPASKQ
jgi:hypothetical protein